jgi:hypothetical protein
MARTNFTIGRYPSGGYDRLHRAMREKNGLCPNGCRPHCRNQSLETNIRVLSVVYRGEKRHNDAPRLKPR